MKKIILITIILILIMTIGYVIKYSTTKIETQENISEDKIIDKHEEHEESIDHEHEHEHYHFAEIEGSKMKTLTIKEVADLWEINSETLLLKIITEFKLQGEYTINTILEEIRDMEYKFSPAMIKDFAEEIRNQN